MTKINDFKRMDLANAVHIARPNPMVTIIRFEGIKSGWSQSVLVTSDRHHDSVHCDRTLEKRHLEEAADRDALVLDFGDLFDAMQGYGDPRGNYDDVRPEYQKGSYLDALVNEADKFYSPYAPNIAYLANGNHETSVYKRYTTGLTDRLASGLRKGNKRCFTEVGQYAGWILFQFVRGKEQSSMRLYYNHGTGGDSASTFGIGQVRKQTSFLSDVDFVVNGHSHNAYYAPMISKGVDQNGTPYDKVVHGIRTPGYKKVFRDAHASGFEVQGGHVPKPVGAAWINFAYKNNIEAGVAVDVH